MGAKYELANFKDVLTDAKLTGFFLFSFYHPTVVGAFEGCEAGFGIRKVSAISRSGIEGFYQIKLKKTLKLPFLLWSRFPLGVSQSKNEIRIENGCWLTMIVSCSEKYWRSQTIESVRGIFDELIQYAKRVENEEVFLEEKMMQDTFGQEYLDYKNKVRRWI